MYNIKLVNACDCLRSVHCQISVTISNHLLPHSSFLTSFLPFFHTELADLHQAYWPHSLPFPYFLITLPQNLSCLCFGLMRLATAFCPGPLFSEPVWIVTAVS